jgi:hypothetical protein
MAIGVILENPSPFDTTADDVVNGARGVSAGLSRHVEKLATGKSLGKAGQQSPSIHLNFSNFQRIRIFAGASPVLP